MYGAYYGTVPAQHKYIDTSQPLNGFGQAELLTIYEGVGALPSAGTQTSKCRCSAGKVGRLAGFGRFGDEVLPGDVLPGTDTVGVTPATNVQTALFGLVLAGSLVAVGAALIAGKSGGKAMRANGRRGRGRMRRNGRKLGGPMHMGSEPTNGQMRRIRTLENEGATQGRKDAVAIRRAAKSKDASAVYRLIWERAQRRASERGLISFEASAYARGYQWAGQAAVH